MHLALGMMEPSGARPAVGTTEDRFVAMVVDRRPQRCGGEVERFVPRHRHERLDATLGAVAAAWVLQVALPHIGLVDASTGVLGVLQRLADR